MWQAFVDFVLNSVRQSLTSGGFLAIAIAGAAALAIWRVPRALYDRDRDGRLATDAAPGRLPRPQPPHAPTPHDIGRPQPPTARASASQTDLMANPASTASHSPLHPRASTFTSPGAPAQEPYTHAHARAARVAAASPDNAPEDTIAPPIWRRVETLIEERRAATSALTGEALGEAPLFQPLAPIWRDVSALRVSVVESEGVVPDLPDQEAPYELASPPAFWRYALLREPLKETLDVHPSEAALIHVEVTSQPPIWTSWISATWPETSASPSLAEVVEAADPDLPSEPPIWISLHRS